MPIYAFKNQHTGQIIELQRKIADRDVPPTLAELIEAKVPDTDGREGLWIRQPATNVGKSRTEGFGRKGEWGK